MSQILEIRRKIVRPVLCETHAAPSSGVQLVPRVFITPSERRRYTLASSCATMAMCRCHGDRQQ